MIMKIEKFEDREVEVFLKRRIYEKGEIAHKEVGQPLCQLHGAFSQMLSL